jgi:Secretion system C-terminal sorting domain
MEGGMKRLWIILLLVGLSIGLVNATPYVDPDLLQIQFEERMRVTEPGPLGFDYGQRDARNVADSVLTVEYLQLLDWLTTMQELNPGPNFGGQHEGETTTWNIIQTDNTQEALRDWAHYARVTGDLERYRTNIDAAWEYTLNFPAYLEEGGGNPNYYRVHNCGWALVAAMEYTEAYGENPNYRAYADSCARYLDRWRLNLSGALNPLAAGFGAGALHTFGVWRDNADWEEGGEEIATGVKEWIEASPNRLNSNETWAMSGGTAMWGVITALFLDDIEAGEEWLPEYLPFMDTYSGPGNWNNSWTVWYGFAWNRAHQVLGTQETLDNAIEVADYILSEAERDDDAGVPGTEGGNHHLDDQSWTSAYQVWYELEQLIHYQPLGEDPVAVDIVGMPEDWPLIIGVEMPLDAVIANAGLQPAPMVTLSCELTFTFPNESSTISDIPVPFGTVVTQSLGSWTPEEEGDATITIDVTSANDVNLDNNYLERTYTVFPARYISGVVSDSLTGEPVAGTIHWTQLEIEPVRSGDVDVNAETGEYSIPVAPGIYVLDAYPSVTPYPSRTVQVTVTNSDISDLDFDIPASRVMLISDYANTEHDSLISEAFAANGYETYVWRIPERGLPGVETQAASLDLLVWGIPQASEVSFDEDEWANVESFLGDVENRYGVLFQGDGVMQSLNAEQKTALEIEDEQVDLLATLIAGIPESPILVTDSLFVGGITPQQAVDGVSSISEDAAPIGDYLPFDSMAGQALDWDDKIGAIILGFGLEGLNDVDGRFVSRSEFVGRLIQWFGQSVEVAESEDLRVLLPADWRIHAYPNPFNSALKIEVIAPFDSHLVLFDILGREVHSWRVGGDHTLIWKAQDVASGMYFLQLQAASETRMQKVMLLR